VRFNQQYRKFTEGEFIWVSPSYQEEYTWTID
jgi:hypothetical protein